MVKIYLHYKTLLSHFKNCFISEQSIGNILQERKAFQNFYSIDFQIIKKKIKTPFYLLSFLMSTFSIFCVFITVINLLYVGIISIQPQFNHYLNQIISEARSLHDISTILKVCFIFAGFKILTSIISITHDFTMPFLGIRFYGLMASTIIKYCGGNTRKNGNLITLVEEDAQKFILLPYSVITIVLRDIQYFFLVGYMVYLIPTYQFQIIAIYAMYFILSVIVSYQCAKINKQILTNKQKRLSFADRTLEQIRIDRQNQLKSNKKMMILNGINSNIADFTNTIVMILIYSVNQIDSSTKYTLLIIFGLLKATVVGIGTAFMTIAEIRTSAQRIIQQINVNIQTIVDHNKDSAKKEQINHQIKADKEELSKISITNSLKYRKILPKIQKQAPYFFPAFGLFFIMCFATYYSYGIFAGSITHGGSALQPMNLLILISQFAVPTLFFAFLCIINLKISRLVYNTILQYPQKIQKLTSEQFNRLNGDSRSVDRSLYTNVHNNFTGIARVSSSLTFSIINLQQPLLCIFFVLVFLILLYVFKILLTKLMIMRRNLYRREVLAKGNLLESLRMINDPKNHLYNVFSFKQFGYALESSFIVSVHVIIVIFIALLIGALLGFSPNSSKIPVLLVMLMQLDSNFVQLCSSWIHYEITMTSTERCMTMIQWFEKSSDVQDSNNLTQSLITQSQRS